jgi:multiple sugar transport system ATP-binding protein
MTVKENMALGLKLRKTPKEEIRRRVAETAELLGIENLLDRKPKALSGGQRQRVALGRAIVRVPRVYLFDEPLSNLDAKLRMHMRLELRKLHDRLETTTIYVTHDQVEAMTMGDRIVVMKDGAIQQAGEPLELYRKPANLFVAGFIGSPPMNVVPASVATENGGLLVKGDGLIVQAPKDKSKALDGYRGRNVILGFRPDDLSAEGDREISMNVRVIVAQSLGNRTYLEVAAGDHTFLASADARTRISSGQEIRVSIDPQNLHFFDSDTEKAIY